VCTVAPRDGLVYSRAAAVRRSADHHRRRSRVHAGRSSPGRRHVRRRRAARLVHDHRRRLRRLRRAGRGAGHRLVSVPPHLDAALLPQQAQSSNSSSSGTMRRRRLGDRRRPRSRGDDLDRRRHPEAPRYVVWVSLRRHHIEKCIVRRCCKSTTILTHLRFSR